MVALIPASTTVLPGLEAMLRTLGSGEAGFSGTSFGRGEQTLINFLHECERQQSPETTDPGRVPRTIFWITDDGRVVGMLRMRHCLNDALRIKGGHIGYYVAPWARRRGVAAAALAGSPSARRARREPRAAHHQP